GIRGFHVTGVQTCALPIYLDVALDLLAAFRQRVGGDFRARRRHRQRLLAGGGGDHPRVLRRGRRGRLRVQRARRQPVLGPWQRAGLRRGGAAALVVLAAALVVGLGQEIGLRRGPRRLRAGPDHGQRRQQRG